LSAFGDDDFGFALIDRVWLEGLAFYFSDDYFVLRPRHYTLT